MNKGEGRGGEGRWAPRRFARKDLDLDLGGWTVPGASVQVTGDCLLEGHW